MALSASSKVLAVILLISAFLGAYLLVYDDILRNYAPTHSIVLAILVILDVVFAGLLLLTRLRIGIKGALGVGIVQFLVMALDPLSASIVDPLSGKPTGGGVSVTEFALYLYGISDLAPPGKYTFTVLIVLQVIIIALALRARRATPPPPKK